MSLTARGALRAVTLLLPLMGLGAAWTISHQRAQRGTVWEVPVQGYDPRDLLRGHYLVYRYDWPGLAEEEMPGPDSALCLEGTPPTIARTRLRRVGLPCPHPVRTAVSDTLLVGRIYIPQAKAAALEAQLADPTLRGIVRLRVRDDGRFVPLDIRFEPAGRGP